jgi:hypothetical protein
LSDRLTAWEASLIKAMEGKAFLPQRHAGPFNALAGGVLLSTRRVGRRSATTSRFRQLASAVEYSGGTPEAFGLDPVFSPNSPLYDNVMDPAAHYAADDPRSGGGLPRPFMVEGSAGEFPYYMEQSVTGMRAVQNLRFLYDGRYLDQYVESLSVSWAPTAPHRLWYQQLLVTRFAASTTHGQKSAAKEARPRPRALTTSKCQLDIWTPRLIVWSGEGVLKLAVSLSTITPSSRCHYGASHQLSV